MQQFLAPQPTSDWVALYPLYLFTCCSLSTREERQTTQNDLSDIVGDKFMIKSAYDIYIYIYMYMYIYMPNINLLATVIMYDELIKKSAGFNI